MKNFFSHDEGARNDPKLIKVLMRLGQAGKGVYWDIIEMLYEQDGYLMLSECDSYAFALRTESNLLQSLIHDFGLFENDGEKFWSNSALIRLERRKGKSLKAAESAAKRWQNADAMRTHSESNAKKGKEKKGKEIDSSLRSESTPQPLRVGEQKKIEGSAAENSALAAAHPEAPPVAAAPPTQPDWEPQARELAAGMYGLWGLGHLQADAQMRVLRFVKTLFAAGKGEQLTAQFIAYRDYKKQRDEQLHSWKTYLGSEAREYADGAWNELDWATKYATFLQTHTHGTSHRNSTSSAAAASRVSRLSGSAYTARDSAAAAG